MNDKKDIADQRGLMMTREPKAALLISVALYGFAFIIVFTSALLFFLPPLVVVGILMLLSFAAKIFGIIIAMRHV